MLRALSSPSMTALASPVAAAPASAPVRSPWFRSAPFDLALILAVPVLTWPLVMLAQRAWGAPLLNQLILVSATGHYFATFVRTYGDRELFARFRVRLLLVPAVLLPVNVALFASGRGPAVLLLTAGWAFWHWLAQAFGFARIYDAKVGSHRPLTAWLDKALVVTGFVATVVLNDCSLAIFANAFADAGLPLPTGASFAVVERVVLVGAIGVGTAYVANLAWTIARGLPWSWQKQLMHVTTIGYYWFAFTWMPNVLVAYVLYELFHDVQYFALTWLTCRQRARRPNVAPWFARMFRPGRATAVAFVVAMLALGGADCLGRTFAPGPTSYQVLLAVSLTAALLHYYFDGFVWKAREQTLGRDLGLPSGLRATVVPGLRHAAAWGLWFVPLAALLLLAPPPPDARARAEALVELAPRDFLSQAQLGFALVSAGDVDRALGHYRAAIDAWPEYGQVRANFGAALELARRPGDAREQYEAALRLPDEGGSHRQARLNLGTLLLAAGERDAATAHLREAARLGAGSPVGRLLELAARRAQHPDEQRQLYSAVLQLEPDQPDARLGLGDVALRQQRYDVAIAQFTAVLRRAPSAVPALLGLARAQVETGRLDDARANVERALAAEPGNPTARALAARLAR
jgi:tetratricopeptide (TPR) repeat protein